MVVVAVTAAGARGVVDAAITGVVVDEAPPKNDFGASPGDVDVEEAAVVEPNMDVVDDVPRAAPNPAPKNDPPVVAVVAGAVVAAMGVPPKPPKTEAGVGALEVTAGVFGSSLTGAGAGTVGVTFGAAAGAGAALLFPKIDPNTLVELVLF